jgi:hypothetical protein
MLSLRSIWCAADIGGPRFCGAPRKILPDYASPQDDSDVQG